MLVHIALGGTISMRVVDGLARPAVSAAELAQTAGIATVPIDLAAVGGPQLDFALMRATVEQIRRAEADGAAGVIVTLGTDAIEEAGAFIAYAGPYGPNVVITGAMEPGGEPGSDAVANLRDAAAVAAGPRLPEPVVVFAGRVALARAVVKVSGLALDAFAAPTSQSWPVAQALSGELPLGSPASTLGAPDAIPADVPIILSAMSVGEPEPALPAAFPPALVFVSSGAGNLAPAAAAHAEAALAYGSVVAIATRALDRRLDPGYGYPGGSGMLARAGAVLATGMSPHRLRIFLLIALSRGVRGEALKRAVSAHVESLAADSHAP